MIRKEMVFPERISCRFGFLFYKIHGGKGNEAMGKAISEYFLSLPKRPQAGDNQIGMAKAFSLYEILLDDKP